MTGNLVKMGQRLAGIFLGRGRWEWLPFFALWAAMVGGAISGAALAPAAGLAALWLAAAGAALLALISWAIDRRA